MKTLKELCSKYKIGGWPDKGDVHSYLEIYETLLAPYRDTAKNVIEIGLMSGESLRMWTEYFSKSTVYGMDITVKPIDGLADLTDAISEGYNIKIGDAANPKDIKKYFKDIKFDVVIEDANHNIEQQLEIYRTLKPYLNAGSIYIIEDIQDIDSTRELFLNLDPNKNIQILDRRHIKNRYDDVLIIIN
jgi:cephalosporin hydroxylase